MFKDLKGSMETKVHICKEGKGKPPVFQHDIMTYMFIEKKQVVVRFCPYCGEHFC